MNCRNCGAPMELFERRRYYYCRHCGSFHFLDPLAGDGIEVLERPSPDVPCPACGGPLAKSLLDRHLVKHCERCRGVLVARQSFSEVIGQRRAAASGPVRTPEPLDRRELSRRVTCPQCRVRMDVHPYYGPGNVIIDTCPQCDLVWLDSGELKQITDAPGRDRPRA